MTPAQACASLCSLFARHPESKQHFLSEGGVLAAMEMLDSDMTKLLEPGGGAGGSCHLIGGDGVWGKGVWGVGVSVRMGVLAAAEMLESDMTKVLEPGGGLQG